MRERILWIGLLFMGFLGWLKSHDSQVKAEARLEQTTKVVHAAEDSVKHLKRQLIISDSAYAKMQADYNRQRAAARVADSSIKAKVDFEVASFRASLDSAQQDRLNTIISDYDRRLDEKDKQIQATANLLRIANQKVDERDEVISAMTNLNSTIGRSYDQAAKMTQPGLLTKVTKAIPLVIFGIAIGKSL